MKTYKVTFFKDLEEKEGCSKGRLIVLSSLDGTDTIRVVVGNTKINFVGKTHKRLSMWNQKKKCYDKPKEVLEKALKIKIEE